MGSLAAVIVASMNGRGVEVLALAAVGAVVAFLPGRGLMGSMLWVGPHELSWMIPMAVLIFCVVFFGTLRLWKLLTGDSLQRPLPEILAVFLAVRLTVDCARLWMWH